MSNNLLKIGLFNLKVDVEYLKLKLKKKANVNKS
jgi:hypothetical protein